jgi:hypothetical protein
MPPETLLADEDRALLERVAGRIVELRLETPAILTLESARPVSLLASTAMTFFEPFVQSLLRLPQYRRFAELAERRDALEVLTRLIEAAAERRDAVGSAGTRP